MSANDTIRLGNTIYRISSEKWREEFIQLIIDIFNNPNNKISFSRTEIIDEIKRYKPDFDTRETSNARLFSEWMFLVKDEHSFSNNEIIAYAYHLLSQSKEEN